MTSEPQEPLFSPNTHIDSFIMEILLADHEHDDPLFVATCENSVNIPETGEIVTLWISPPRGYRSGPSC